MMKSLAVVVLAGVLLLAGCGSVQTPPQAARAAVSPPPERMAEPNGLPQDQVRSSLIIPPSDATSTPREPVEEVKPVTAGPGPVTPHPADRDEQTENAPPAEHATQVRAEPVRAGAPVLNQQREPGDAKPNEPNDTAKVPAPLRDVTTGAREEGAFPVFGEYAEILKTCVREDGRVDYGSLRRRRLDLKPLLMKLGELDPNTYESWSREQKVAFWINAYNLKMLDIISRNYPIQSSWWLRLTWPPDDIRHIRGIWTDFRLVVMDEEFTLGEIERRLFQRTFDDPRVYLALTYASQSSPVLRPQPYRGDALDRQLDEQVKQFLSSPRGLQIDRRNLVVRLSALFKPTWRGGEFVPRYGTDKKFKTCDPPTRAVLSFVSGYLSREDAYFLEVENYTIEYINFDWRLNDTARGY